MKRQHSTVNFASFGQRLDNGNSVVGSGHFSAMRHRKNKPRPLSGLNGDQSKADY
ncbi:hypothetical protein [Bartonella apis]|uniref:hypothetical protein n=1 Tax=Bartonella apis TaxID=1686310 RepID=UPI0018DC6199|nr:hypothetical protein [Bartonella apis]MBI0177681.1 hypothetical protein [Bartonella apis]